MQVVDIGSIRLFTYNVYLYLEVTSLPVYVYLPRYIVHSGGVRIHRCRKYSNVYYVRVCLYKYIYYMDLILKVVMENSQSLGTWQLDEITISRQMNQMLTRTKLERADNFQALEVASYIAYHPISSHPIQPNARYSISQEMGHPIPRLHEPGWGISWFPSMSTNDFSIGCVFSRQMSVVVVSGTHHLGFFFT